MFFDNNFFCDFCQLTLLIYFEGVMFYVFWLNLLKSLHWQMLCGEARLTAVQTFLIFASNAKEL